MKKKNKWFNWPIKAVLVGEISYLIVAIFKIRRPYLNAFRVIQIHFFTVNKEVKTASGGGRVKRIAEINPVLDIDADSPGRGYIATGRGYNDFFVLMRNSRNCHGLRSGGYSVVNRGCYSG